MKQCNYLFSAFFAVYFLRNILKREQYEKSLNLISVLLFLFCSENWSQLSICLLQTRSSLSQENCSFCPALSSHICQCCYCFPANITFEFLFQPQFNVSSCCLKQFSCLERLMAQHKHPLLSQPTYAGDENSYRKQFHFDGNFA